MTTPPEEFRRDALRAITTAYTATHGHPLERESMDQSGVRWSIPMRVAVFATSFIAVVGIVIGGWLLGQRQASSGSQQTVTVGGNHASSDALQAADGDDAAKDPHGKQGASAAPGVSVDAVTENDREAGEQPEVIVHVAGEVTEPGIVHLPAGARTADAIAAAGGPTVEAELNSINLARIVEDGEQIYVPQPGETIPVPAGEKVDDEATSGPADETVNLNTASHEELQSLPGIGPAMADRIIAWREANGEFTRVDQLLEVRGIGPRVFAELQVKVSV